MNELYEETIKEYGFARVISNSGDSNTIYYVDYERLDMYAIRKLSEDEFIVFF